MTTYHCPSCGAVTCYGVEYTLTPHADNPFMLTLEVVSKDHEDGTLCNVCNRFVLEVAKKLGLGFLTALTNAADASVSWPKEMREALGMPNVIYDDTAPSPASLPAVSPSPHAGRTSGSS